MSSSLTSETLRSGCASRPAGEKRPLGRGTGEWLPWPRRSITDGILDPRLRRQAARSPGAPLPGGRAAACFSVAACVYQVEEAAIFGRTRSVRRVAEARQLAMYLAHTTLRLSYGEIAALLNRDRTTVRHGIQRIEDRRDNAQFDGLLHCLEALVREISSPAVARLIFAGGPDRPDEERSGL